MTEERDLWVAVKELEKDKKSLTLINEELDVGVRALNLEIKGLLAKNENLIQRLDDLERYTTNLETAAEYLISALDHGRRQHVNEGIADLRKVLAGEDL